MSSSLGMVRETSRYRKNLFYYSHSESTSSANHSRSVTLPETEGKITFAIPVGVFWTMFDSCALACFAYQYQTMQMPYKGTISNQDQQSMNNDRQSTDRLEYNCDSLGSSSNMHTPKQGQGVPTQSHYNSSPQQLQQQPTQIQTRCVAGVQIASIFAEPSAYLQQALRNKASSKPAEFCQRRPSRQNSFDMAVQQRQEDLLHRACCSQETSIEKIQQILASDPLAASRPLILSSEAMEKQSSLETSHVTAIKSSCSFMKSYMYPLNLAIHHQLSQPVLALLIRAAPQVLLLPDGPRQESSLHTLLRHSPHDTKTVLDMLLHQPALASSVDQHGNCPLHIAVQFNATSETIQYLCWACPETEYVRNRAGQTPTDLMMVYKNGGKECPAA